MNAPEAERLRPLCLLPHRRRSANRRSARGPQAGARRRADRRPSRAARRLRSGDPVRRHSGADRAPRPPAGRGGAADLRRRLSRPTAGDAAALLRQPPSRRSGDRALARRRAARPQRRSRRAPDSTAGRRRCAGVSPIASTPRTPAASSICGRAKARRRSRRPAFFVTKQKRHASRNSCDRGCRVALPGRRRTTRTLPATLGAGIDAHRDDRRGLCRLGLGGLFRRLRS